MLAMPNMSAFCHEGQFCGHEFSTMKQAGGNDAGLTKGSLGSFEGCGISTICPSVYVSNPF